MIALERLHARALVRSAAVADGGRGRRAHRRRQHLARENGLLFPPDPGAAEQSQIGGNVATNAGGPHALQVRRHRAPGSPGWRRCWRPASSSASAGRCARTSRATTSRAAGRLRGHAGHHHRGLAAAASRRPRRAAGRRVLRGPRTPAATRSSRVDGVRDVAGGDRVPRRRDAGVAGPALPGAAAGRRRASPSSPRRTAARPRRRAARELRSRRSAEGALARARAGAADSRAVALARRRLARRRARLRRQGLRGRRGPLERLGEAIARHARDRRPPRPRRAQLGPRRRRQPALHVPRRPGRRGELERAERAAADLFALARRLGGTVSGEHGLGTLKRGAAGWAPPVAGMQQAIKRAFDPRGIMNPGKKL